MFMNLSGTEVDPVLLNPDLPQALDVHESSESRSGSGVIVSRFAASVGSGSVSYRGEPEIIVGGSDGSGSGSSTSTMNLLSEESLPTCVATVKSVWSKT